MFDDFLKYCDLSVQMFYYFTVIITFFYVIFYSIKRSIFSLENYFILMSIVIPLLVMVPFSFSSFNVYASWDFFRYRPLINDAVTISCFGILSFLGGATVSRFNIFYKIDNPSFLLKGIDSFWFGFNNFYIRLIIFLVMLTLFMYITIFLGVALGEGRGFAMENPYLRPIFNLFSIVILYFIVYFYSYALHTKNKSLYILGVGLFFLALVVGTRSLILQPLVFLFFMECFIKNTRITLSLLLKVFILASTCIYVAILISDIRNNGSTGTSFLFSFLYGNNYSDIRDFAWVLYGWDGNFLFGKTELSGILSFMPSFISDFRQHWSWGVFSTTIVGLNPDEHPGLRPGFFGESYVNFGYFGVFLVGSLIGFFIHKYDTLIDLKKKEKNNMAVIKLYTFGFVYLGIIGSFAITAGFFGVYVTLILIAIFSMMRLLLTTKRTQ